MDALIKIPPNHPHEPAKSWNSLWEIESNSLKRTTPCFMSLRPTLLSSSPPSFFFLRRVRVHLRLCPTWKVYVCVCMRVLFIRSRACSSFFYVFFNEFIGFFRLSLELFRVKFLLIELRACENLFFENVSC